MARRNYAGEKWTKEDIRRVENETGRSMKETARRENKELDEMTRQARYERRDNEMSNNSNKSHRLTEEERIRKQQREQANRAANQDAVQVRDAMYGNNTRANQREIYKKQNERAARQDNAQYEQPYYESNQRAQQRRLQAQEEQARYNAKATRDEATHKQQAHQNRVNRSSTRGYEKEEAAFNRGRNPGADRMNAERLRNQRALTNTINNARRGATNLVKSGTVPSTNPTAAGGNGREWKNHKYTAKVVGKNGKVRYIYGDAKRGITGDDLNRAKEELKKAHVALNRPSNDATLKISQNKATSRNTGGGNKVHNPIDELRRGVMQTGANVRNAAGNIKKAASDGANFVKSQVSGALANTPLKDLFK